MLEQFVEVVVFQIGGVFDGHEVLEEVDLAVGEAEGGSFSEFVGSFSAFCQVLAETGREEGQVPS